MNKILISKTSKVADPLEQKELIGQLTVDRQAQMHRLRNAEDRKRCYLAGKLLQVMCDEMNIENPVFETGERGKTYIKGNAKTVFNISHSGEYVVLAFISDTDAEVGIDIQKKKPLQERTVKKILCEKEACRHPDLLSLWAVKEAFIKWDGRGLSIPFTELEWKEDGSVSYDVESKTAYVQEIFVEKEYRCFVCTDIPDIKWEVCYIEG